MKFKMLPVFVQQNVFMRGIITKQTKYDAPAKGKPVRDRHSPAAVTQTNPKYVTDVSWEDSEEDEEKSEYPMRCEKKEEYLRGRIPITDSDFV